MVIDDPELSVFEKTFSGYLKQVRKLDPLPMKNSLEISLVKDEIAVPLVHKKYLISKNDITNRSGKRTSFDKCIIL